MLVLDQQSIKDLLDYHPMVDAVEHAYRLFASGKVFTPDRPSIEYNGDTLLYMPCFTDSLLGTKMLTLFPDNPSRNHPYIYGLMVLNDRTTGKPLAIMDGSLLTAIRTGAAGSVAIRHFSRPDSKKMMVVGAGKQGFYQALFASRMRDLDEIVFVDRSKGPEHQYINDFKEVLQNDRIKVSIISDPALRIKDMDIVTTTTTSNTPVLPDDASMLKDKLFVGIGSYKPTMREYPGAVWNVVKKVFIELPYAMEETGDLADPLKEGLIQEGVINYIGDYLNEPYALNLSERDSVWFKSVGMSIMDLIGAQWFYEEAQKTGKGTEIDL